MGSVPSIDNVIENLKSAHDGATIEALDLRDDSDDQPDFRESLERLRDSTDGGFVLLLCSDALSCEQVAKKFEHLTHCFPVLDSRADDVEEGTLWAAVVAGTRGAPGEDSDSVSLLRAGELGLVPDATFKDLDLSLVGIRWPVPQSNKGRKSVLRMIRQGIATQADGKLRPTVAGLVALGRSPQTFLPGMRIELSTGTKEVCWRGSLPTLLQKARYYRQPRLASIPFALEEIVLNALLHRDWRPQYHHEPVRISFEERELVCTHPCLLDEDWRVGKSLPPNAALHALVRRLRPSKTNAPGLQRIDAVLSGMELRPVTLHAKKNWIKVVVPWTEAAPSVRTESPDANSRRPKSRKSSSTHGTAYPHLQVPVRVPSPHIYAREPTYPAQHSSPYSHHADLDTARLPAQRQPDREPPAPRASPGRPISMNSSQAPGPNEAAPRPYPTEVGAQPVEPRRSAVRPKEDMRVRKVSRGEVRPTKVGAKNPESTSRGQRVAPPDNKRSNSQPSNHRDSDGVNRSVPERARDDNTRLRTTNIMGPGKREHRRLPEERARIGPPLEQELISVSNEAGLRCSGPDQPVTTKAQWSMAGRKPSTPASPQSAHSNNERDEAVIRLLRREGPQTTKQLMKTLKCTRWAIRTTLDRLMAANIVKAAAASSTSPNQTYELV